MTRLRKKIKLWMRPESMRRFLISGKVWFCGVISKLSMAFEAQALVKIDSNISDLKFWQNDLLSVINVNNLDITQNINDPS